MIFAAINYFIRYSKMLVFLIASFLLYLLGIIIPYGKNSPSFNYLVTLKYNWFRKGIIMFDSFPLPYQPAVYQLVFFKEYHYELIEVYISDVFLIHFNHHSF